ncbi:MAG: SDR family oxidoreductase [Planctomycetes bacterium]|nr:SDR family oxidoreductase [Planctomycetota bacterium]
MDGAIAIVTGASRGIGHAIAHSLAARGARVLLVARDAARLAAVAGELGGATAVPCAVDLRAPDAPERVLAACRDRLGPPDIVVNNAGTAPSAPFERTTDAMLDEVLDLHVRMPFRLLRAAWPDLRHSAAGTVVQLASTAGLRGYAYTSAYTTAKHAMLGTTRALAAELGTAAALRIYAVCPGFVDTDVTRGAARALAAGRTDRSEADVLRSMAAMNRLGRLHTAAEVGEAVARLCAERPTGGVVLDLDRDPPAFVDAPDTSPPG